MRNILIVALAASLGTSGCEGDDSLELVVEVRTDLRPGVDFNSVQVGLDTAPPIAQPALAGEDYFAGRRVAERSGLAAGAHRVAVSLRDESGDAVADRVVAIDLRADLGVTVVVSVACRGLTCSPEGGDERTCFAGRCVSTECSELSPDACGSPECGGDADCSAVPCGACAQGACLSDPACGIGMMDAGGDTDAGGADTSPGDGAVPPNTCDAADPGLRGCWLFESDLSDGSGNGHDLTSTAPSFADSMSRRGMAMSGPTPPGDPVQAAAGSGYGFAQGTWQMWIRPRTVPTTGRFGLMELDGAYGIFLHPSGEVRCRLIAAGAGETVIAPGAVSVGTWQHVACTADGMNARLFVDGVERASEPIGGDIPVPMSSIFIVGSDAPAGDDPFDGEIDSVMIYDYVRSAADLLRDATP